MHTEEAPVVGQAMLPGVDITNAQAQESLDVVEGTDIQAHNYHPEKW